MPVGAEPLELRRLLSAALDDPFPPEVVALDRLASEGQGQVLFTVEIPAGDQPVTLDYSTVPGTAAEGTDYEPVAGSLSFAPDTAPRVQTVAVPLVDDPFYEETEWFYLELSNVAGATFPGGASTYRATATVRDDDPQQQLRVADARVVEPDAGTANADFVVSLSRPHDRPISVDFATADGTATVPADYFAASGTLVFEPGETSKTVSVAVRGDTLDESDETFLLRLRAPVNALLADAQATGTIVEDDDHPPTANVVDVAPDPRTAPVDSVQIVFAEPVSGLDMSDLALTRDGGPNLLSASQSVTTSDGGVHWTVANLADVTLTAGRYTLSLKAAGSGVIDRDGNALAADASDSWRTYASVAGRQVFYNNSFFDGDDPAASAADDDAVAADKQALLPGAAADFSNVTGYAKGLNGVMVDVSGLSPGAGPTAADFALSAGNASQWSPAPAPLAVAVRRGAGAGGSDRVTLTFADGAIRNEWLRVEMLADDRTGLKTSDVFYFGNLPGDTGDRPGAIKPSVDAWDVIATHRAATAGPTTVTTATDHNRDGRVNALDLAVSRGNFLRALTPLPTAPASFAPLRPAQSATALLRD